MTLASAVTAGLMLLLFCRLGHVAWVDMVFITAVQNSRNSAADLLN